MEKSSVPATTAAAAAVVFIAADAGVIATDVSIFLALLSWQRQRYRTNTAVDLSSRRVVFSISGGRPGG